jgi:hypothetical protein
MMDNKENVFESLINKARFRKDIGSQAFWQKSSQISKGWSARELAQVGINSSPTEARKFWTDLNVVYHHIVVMSNKIRQCYVFQCLI